MSTYTGDIHPFAALFPLLSDDEMSALAEDIAANGQTENVVIDQQGRLVDGRNRVAACALVNVEPAFAVVEFASEDEIRAFILSRNVERRNLTKGQQAMARAIDYARQGNRVDGRWKRGTVDIGSSSNIDTWRKAMNKAGIVIDTAARAEALGDWTEYVVLPEQVMSGAVTLDGALRLAEGFDGTLQMAESRARQPLIEALSQIEVLVEEIGKYVPLPEMAVGISRGERSRMNAIVKGLREAATQISGYGKEDK